MHKLYLILIVCITLTGCGVGYSYPEGATSYEKWQIDRYYEDRLQQQINNFNRQYSPRQQNCSYLNGMLYCW